MTWDCQSNLQSRLDGLSRVPPLAARIARRPCSCNEGKKERIVPTLTRPMEICGAGGSRRVARRNPGPSAGRKPTGMHGSNGCGRANIASNTEIRTRCLLSGSEAPISAIPNPIRPFFDFPLSACTIILDDKSYFSATSQVRHNRNGRCRFRPNHCCFQFVPKTDVESARYHPENRFSAAVFNINIAGRVPFAGQPCITKPTTTGISLIFPTLCTRLSRSESD